MVNVKTKKVEKKSVKKPGSSLEKKSSKRKLISQKRKHSAKQVTSSEKQKRTSKAVNNSSIKKRAKKTTNKRAKSKVVAQEMSFKQNIYEGVFKEPDTLKIREENEIGRMENFIEEISQKPEPIDQKKIPIVEARKFLTKCVNRYKDILSQRF